MTLFTILKNKLMKGGQEKRQTMKKLLEDKKGIFGLTAVQQFFTIILGIGLLAYVIVVIMGTLQTSSILTSSSHSFTNDSIAVSTSGTSLSCVGYGDNPVCTIGTIINDSATVNATEYSNTACVIANTSIFFGTPWNITYSCTYDSFAQKGTKNILGNTSAGISSFFGAINPVYAILAVLVIILVLVVLVRVVSGGGGMSGGKGTPQL